MTQPDLRELREARGLTQSDLGLHKVIVSRYECGHHRPRGKALQKIAAALTAAHPAEPVSVPAVVAAIRESQRRAQASAPQAGPASDFAAQALAGKAPERRLPKPDAAREAGREHHADGSVSIDYRDGSSLTFPPAAAVGPSSDGSDAVAHDDSVASAGPA
jgi:transcriptional regulator with XRE-family HTH domain